MDIPFLKLMSEAYVSDSIEPLNINEITDYLLSSFGGFKIDYPEVAKELYQKTRAYHQDVIYSFLDKKFLKEDEAVEFNIHEGFLEDHQNIPGFKFLSKLKKAYQFLNLDPKLQFMTTLVDKKYNNCNGSCSNGINLDSKLIIDLLYSPKNRIISNDIKKLIKSDPSFDINNTSKCLRVCYLDYLTSIYAEGIISFETCTKKLGGNEIIISTYTDMLKNYPISGLCLEIYVTLNDLYKELTTLLEYIYNDDFVIKKWLNVINLKLEAFRNGRSYVMDFSKVDDDFVYPKDYIKIV